MSQAVRAPSSGGVFRGTTLDLGQYLALWRHLGLGQRPLLLDALDHGDTYAERDALDAAAWQRLAAQGLLDARGAPDPELADMLAVLAAPACTVDARILAEGAEPHGVVAAERGGLALVAERAGNGGLRLDAADPGDLAGALVARLPDRRAAPGVPMTVPLDAFGGVTPADRSWRLRRAGAPRHVVERLTAMWARPPERVLQLGVSVRARHGATVRGPRILAVVDTAVGRFVLDGNPAGPRMVFRPIDRGRLHTELAGVVADHLRAVAARS